MVINTVMKLKDVINESATDIVARFYIEASKPLEEFYSPEDVKYKDKNSKYYDEHFKSWFNEEIVPVFTKPVTPPQPAYTNKPEQGKLQSPGYRGLQYAKAAADLPYDRKVQRYEPSSNKVVPSPEMDAARNNNGQ
jgi:hypothetical protein